MSGTIEWRRQTAVSKVAPPSLFPQVQSITETTANSTDRSSHAIAIPAVLNTGDLLVVFFACDGTTTTDPISIDADNSGSNWTGIFNTDESSSVMACIFWKIADASNNTLTVTSNDNQISTAQTYRITNFYSTDPIKATKTSASTSNPINTPSNTGDYGADDYLWIVAYGADGYLSYATAVPDNFSDLLSTTGYAGGGSCNLNTARREYNVNGAYSPGSFTCNLTDEGYCSFTVIINPPQ